MLVSMTLHRGCRTADTSRTMPMSLKLVLWFAIEVVASAIWVVWASRRNAGPIPAFVVAVAAAALSGVVCGVPDQPVKMLVFVGILTPFYFVALIWIWRVWRSAPSKSA
jgi:hypothetical protein